ncbi:hypothetical protein Vretimale_16626 [Volvox reticuliferus]|nr:hypothetical protein Vretimale_16626 [Volvox reticuliferus]
MPLALRALASEHQPEGVHFNFDPETGALSWTWPAREVGMSAGAQQAVMLQRLKDGDVAPLEDVLATMWESCYRLLVSCRQLDAQLQRQTDSLNRTQRELQDCTEKHKSLVQELHIKFARVLDAKKDKLIEQRIRIQQLEEQLKAARQELAEAEAVHTDEEGEEDAEADPEGEEQRRRRSGKQPESEAPMTRMTAPYSTDAVEMAARLDARDKENLRRVVAMGVMVEPSAVAPQRVGARAIGGDGAIAAGEPAPGQAPAIVSDEMEWELGHGMATMEQPSNMIVTSSAKATVGTEWTTGPLPPTPVGSTYASLGSTQVDDELLAAATQPAAHIAPPRTGGLQQQVPQTLLLALSRRVPPAADHRQPLAGQQVITGSGAPAGLRPSVLLGGYAGPGSSDASGHPGRTAGGVGVSYDNDDDDEDDDDDDAALGLMARR